MTSRVCDRSSADVEDRAGRASSVSLSDNGEGIVDDVVILNVGFFLIRSSCGPGDISRARDGGVAGRCGVGGVGLLADRTPPPGALDNFRSTLGCRCIAWKVNFCSASQEP